jgi:hypothetical protein
MYRELVRNEVKGGMMVIEGDQILISQTIGKHRRVRAKFEIPKGTPPRTFSHAIIFEVEGEHGMKDAIGGMLANPA